MVITPPPERNVVAALKPARSRVPLTAKVLPLGSAEEFPNLRVPEEIVVVPV